MFIVLFGPPGAGKGTIASKLVLNFSISHISTGDIFRRHIVGNSDIGKIANGYIKKGQLVPSEITTAMVEEEFVRLDVKKKGCVIDGYPRTKDQIEWLRKNVHITCYVLLLVDDVTAIKRLSGRRTHVKSGRSYHVLYHPPKISDRDDITNEPLITRSDDTPEKIKTRLSVYHNKIQTIIPLIKKQETYLEIDARRPVDEVYSDLCKAIK